MKKQNTGIQFYKQNSQAGSGKRDHQLSKQTSVIERHNDNYLLNFKNDDEDEIRPSYGSKQQRKAKESRRILKHVGSE